MGAHGSYEGWLEGQREVTNQNNHKYNLDGKEEDMKCSECHEKLDSNKICITDGCDLEGCYSEKPGIYCLSCGVKLDSKTKKCVNNKCESFNQNMLGDFDSFHCCSCETEMIGQSLNKYRCPKCRTLLEDNKGIYTWDVSTP